MKRMIAFFEIPAVDFHRAVDFYEAVLNVKLMVWECENEKMACFCEGSEIVGAISYAKDFQPSASGVLISFNCESIEDTLKIALGKQGKVIIPKTKIQVDGRGFFAVLADSEGNHVGLYADR